MYCACFAIDDPFLNTRN